MSTQETTEQELATAIAHIIDSLHELGKVNAVNSIFLRVDPDKLTPVIRTEMREARERGASLWEAEIRRRCNLVATDGYRERSFVRSKDFDRVQSKRNEWERKALDAERRVEKLEDALSEMAEQIRLVSGNTSQAGVVETEGGGNDGNDRRED